LDEVREVCAESFPTGAKTNDVSVRIMKIKMIFMKKTLVKNSNLNAFGLNFQRLKNNFTLLYI